LEIIALTLGPLKNSRDCDVTADNHKLAVWESKEQVGNAQKKAVQSRDQTALLANSKKVTESIFCIT
jgi:hypothetical protein